MACYVATLRQTLRGQQVINRFSYVSTVEPSGVNGSNLLAKYMGAFPVVDGAFPDGTLMLHIQNIQSDAIHFNELEVVNLYDDTDFYVFPWVTDVLGADTEGEDASPVLAMGFRSNRVTRAIRRGTKRFAGVPSARITTGGEFDTGFKAGMQEVADAMGEVLNPDNTLSEGTYVPAVFKYQSYTTDSGRKAYKPQATEGAQLANAAVGVSWEIYDFVRTQNSRQYGRGA